MLGSIRRALAQRAPGTVVDAITVAATGRLLEDLSQHARSIAEYLGIPRVDVIAFPDQLGAAGSMFGRSSRGERWGFHVPGEIRPSPRPTLRVRTAHRSRLRPIIAPGGAATAEVDFLDDAVRAREDAVRAWVPLLDARSGSPALRSRQAGDPLASGHSGHRFPFSRLVRSTGLTPRVWARGGSRSGPKTWWEPAV